MAMKMLNTRVALRADTHEGWEKNKTKELLKGEVGIEIFPNGQKKIKIGHGGVDSTWGKLQYFGSSAAMSGENPPTEDTLADVGTVYVTNGGLIFICTANSGTKCTWVQLGTSEDANTTYTLSLDEAITGKIKLTASDSSPASEVKLVAGANVTITQDAQKNKITIASTYKDTDTGATAITTDGSGVAVDSATYSADNRTITLHKGFTETPVTVTDAATGNGLVTSIAKGDGTHTITSTKGVTYADTIGEGSSTILPTTKAVNDFVTSKMSTVDAMRYKGTVDNSNDLPTKEVKKGDTYKVTFEKSYLGKAAKVGDLFIANADNVSTGAGWDLIPSGDDGNTFHDTLTADALVIGKDAKTIKPFANGQNGQVLKMVSGKLAWAEDKDTPYELKPAGPSVLGGFETGYAETEGKKYGVQMSGNKAYVSVPWENTEYQDVVSNGASGLMSGADKKKLDDLKNYTLPTASSDALGGIKADQATKGTGKVYDVKLDSATKKPFVQVDWTDHNNVYTAGTDITLGGNAPSQTINVNYTVANLTTGLNDDITDTLVLYGGNAAGQWPQA